MDLRKNRSDKILFTNSGSTVKSAGDILYNGLKVDSLVINIFDVVGFDKEGLLGKVCSKTLLGLPLAIITFCCHYSLIKRAKLITLQMRGPLVYLAWFITAINGNTVLVVEDGLHREYVDNYDFCLKTLFWWLTFHNFKGEVWAPSLESEVEFYKGSITHAVRPPLNEVPNLSKRVLSKITAFIYVGNIHNSRSFRRMLKILERDYPQSVVLIFSRRYIRFKSENITVLNFGWVFGESLAQGLSRDVNAIVHLPRSYFWERIMRIAIPAKVDYYLEMGCQVFYYGPKRAIVLKELHGRGEKVIVLDR